MAAEYSDEVIRFNATLDARDLLRRMGYATEAIYVEDGLIRVFCPIHKDQVRRSLVIDSQQRTFRCQYTQCPAHRGGLLITLFAMHGQIDVEEAVKRLRGEGVENEEKPLLEQAAQLIEAQNYAEALPLLLKARELNPSNTITRCKLASLYLEMGDKDKGQKEYLSAAEDYGVRGELDKTLSIYNLLIILAPQDIVVHKQLAYLFSRLGRPVEAAEHLKWAVDQFLAHDHLDEAANMCEQMAVLTPNEPLVHSLLADILVRFGSLDQAIGEYETATRLLVDRGEWQMARETAIKGLRFGPGHAGLLGLKGQIDTQLAGQGAAAMGAAEPAPEDDFSQWIASLEEEIDKPVETRLESVQISPDDARVLMCRAQLETIEDLKLSSMNVFLRDMFQDVRKNYDQGVMSPQELRVIKEFYRAFCIAYEQIRRERGL